MHCLMFVYRGSSRELRKIVVAILKAGLAKNIKRINYVQDYSFDEKIVKKNEEKILLIYAENQDKLIDFLSKNFPQKMEKMDIN